MKKKRVLIVPCCTDTATATVFQYDRDMCMINCVRAISGITLDKFDEVIFVLYRPLAENLFLQPKISADIGLLCTKKYKGKIPFDVKFILLSSMTLSPAETVYNALLATQNKEGCMIFIKDADGYFNVANNDFIYNNMSTIFTANLEDMTDVDTMHKSYIKTDEQGFITNAIEKHVISGQFCAGGYVFNDVKDFFDGYDALKKITSKFYISDIVFWNILNKDMHFVPAEAYNFEDFNI